MSNSSLEEQRPSFEDDSTVATSSQQQNTTNQSQSDSAAASMCTGCQKPATYMCSSCGLSGPRYCSVDCQKVDWKENHGSVCQATIAARQSRRATRMTTTTAQTAIGDSNNTNTGGDIALNDLTAASSRTAREDNNGEDAGMILFYMQQIYYVIKPVVACIVLSIFWVKVSFSGSSDYKPTRSSYGIIITSDTTTTASSAGDGGGGSGGGTSPLVGSLATALIIIGQIILVTVVILFLFKKGWMKALVGFFMIVVLLLLGFMTYLLLLNVIQVFLIPMDYITMSFALWNFTVVGLVSVFYAGPLWLQQSYLTVMSSLMAFSLTGLEEWTTWFLLGLLAIWDLIAVLCPFGPLRLLIESSRSQQRDVPALLYSVNAVWLMLASSNHLRLSKTFEGGNKATSTNYLSSSSSPLSTTNDMLNTHPSNHEEEGEEQDTPIPSGQRRLLPRTVTATSLPDTLHSTTTSIASEYEASMSSTAPLQMNNNSFLTQLSLPSTTGTDVNTTTTGQIRLRAENTTTEHEIDRQVSGDQQPLSPNLEENGRDARRETRDNSNEDQENRRNSSGRDEDEERDGLKLGLGDFVFYSVLIARAALYDWITTICCTIAVLTGLTATIFLLAIYKRALPALPISIAFGVLFYFVAKTVLVPYISALCVFDMVGL